MSDHDSVELLLEIERLDAAILHWRDMMAKCCQSKSWEQYRHAEKTALLLEERSNELLAQL